MIIIVLLLQKKVAKMRLDKRICCLGLNEALHKSKVSVAEAEPVPAHMAGLTFEQ